MSMGGYMKTGNKKLDESLSAITTCGMASVWVASWEANTLSLGLMEYTVSGKIAAEGFLVIAKAYERIIERVEEFARLKRASIEHMEVATGGMFGRFELTFFLE